MFPAEECIQNIVDLHFEILNSYETAVEARDLMVDDVISESEMDEAFDDYDLCFKNNIREINHWETQLVVNLLDFSCLPTDIAKMIAKYCHSTVDRSNNNYLFTNYFFEYGLNEVYEEN
jgi:hypothetical protein